MDNSPNPAKPPLWLPQFIAAGCYVFAAFVALGVALLTLDHALSVRQVILMAGFAALLIGWGGVFAELATKRILLRPGSVWLKIVVAGAVAMAGAQAFA